MTIKQKIEDLRDEGFHFRLMKRGEYLGFLACGVYLTIRSKRKYIYIEFENWEGKSGSYFWKEQGSMVSKAIETINEYMKRFTPVVDGQHG
jgi:hypothetical protein